MKNVIPKGKNRMNKELFKQFEKIVKERFEHIETLETRNRDALDFHEVSVWGLEEILQKAYELGRASK